ncbi:MAG: YncE family protein, partial [Actinomycetes bacterium]
MGLGYLWNLLLSILAALLGWSVAPPVIPVTIPLADHYIYAIDRANTQIDVISVSTGVLAATITTGSGMDSLIVSPSGHHLYVGGSTGVGVFDTVTNSLVASVPTSANIEYLAVTPDG